MVEPGHPARLELSGEFAARRNGHRVAFAYRGAERLLAYLALHGESPREEIAVALWPNVEHALALTNLRQALRAASKADPSPWVVTQGRSLRLAPGVSVERPEGGEGLLSSWDDPWLVPFRAPREIPETVRTEDALRGLFDLLSYLGARSPEAAMRVASESQDLLLGAPPLRVMHALKALLGGASRVTKESCSPWMVLARAYYLQGRMEEAFDAYERVISEMADGPPEWIAGAWLSQIVVLRESGAEAEAARRAERAAASAPRTAFFRWTTAYQLGYTRHLAGAPASEGLWLARDAIEGSASGDNPILCAFPVLNVAQALFDCGERRAAERCLAMGTALARVSGDPLAIRTGRMIEQLGAAAEGDPENALIGLREMEDEALRARFVPFAASVADRTARLAHRLGRKDEALLALERSDRIRRDIGLRRTLLERRSQATIRQA